MTPYEWSCPDTKLSCELVDGEMRIQFSLDNEEMGIAHHGYADYLVAQLVSELDESQKGLMACLDGVYEDPNS